MKGAEGVKKIGANFWHLFECRSFKGLSVQCKVPYIMDLALIICINLVPVIT